MVWCFTPKHGNQGGNLLKVLFNVLTSTHYLRKVLCKPCPQLGNYGLMNVCFSFASAIYPASLSINASLAVRCSKSKQIQDSYWKSVSSLLFNYTLERMSKTKQKTTNIQTTNMGTATSRSHSVHRGATRQSTHRRPCASLKAETLCLPSICHVASLLLIYKKNTKDFF